MLTVSAQYQKIPTKDVYIHSGTPNTNNGSSSLLLIEHSDVHGEGYSLIQFDLTSIPENAIIEAASLSLYCSRFNGSNVELYIAIGGAVWPSYIYNNWDYIKIYSSTTDISTEFSLPSNYILYNNYPNPFNPTTKIKYQIPQSNLVQIVVYDILGRKVTTLVNEQKPAGNYEVEFNASQFSSGDYFYELRAGDFRDVKKLVLLK